MIAKLNEPIKTLCGNLTKEHYARMQYGKVVIQRRPKRISHLLRHKNGHVRPLPKSTQVNINFYQYIQELSLIDVLIDDHCR